MTFLAGTAFVAFADAAFAGAIFLEGATFLTASVFADAFTDAFTEADAGAFDCALGAALEGVFCDALFVEALFDFDMDAFAIGISEGIV